ncbi:DEAD/DEAH box helicase [Succinatimonas hippei]|uniref:DEAD/DEAH box helicase n=1 Tax=Succinatimonas hippei TaxID=626938 RepID=UPI002010D05D|nr:DEAD/DEAH box helicase [Succinatimonas hippei]MCL1602482.1 DEAD/DEAH box helicase [Succinatimonas hippei]
MSFFDLDLPEEIVACALAQGWQQPTAVQTLVIPKALEGHDILGGAPTGTGKSAAFLLPALARLLTLENTLGVKVLVLEPTRELAVQVADVASSLISAIPDAPYTSATIIGGAGRDMQREQTGTITVATPGRLLEFLRKDWFDPSTVEILVIDEADRMLDMGFRDDVASIVRELSNRYQTMLFSATLEGFGINDFARQVLNDPIEVRLGAGGENDEKLPEFLSSRAYFANDSEQKFKILKHLLTTVQGRSIIFVKTKSRLADVSGKLRRSGFAFASLQGELSQTERKAALRRFADSSADILIATDVASRGLDLPDVTHVYNYDLPTSAAVYVHRAGRTARAGAKGVVISIVEGADLEKLQAIERYTDRVVERRTIKGICEEFPKDVEFKLSTQKRGRASIGGKGGFDRKRKDEEEKKPKVKKRWRVTKNIGKPDFAAKRAKKAARLAKKAEQTKED